MVVPSQRIFQFVVIHTVKCFSVVNEAGVDVFLEFPCFFYDLVDGGNLVSGFSAFSKSSLYTWKFSVHVLLKPAWRILSITLVAREIVQLYGNLNILWLWPSLGLEWKLIFFGPVATAEFSKFSGILNAAPKQRYLLGFEIAQLKFHHLH